MTTKLSSTGKVALPGSIRKKLDLHPGDRLEASIEGDRIVLARPVKRRSKARIITDPATGLVVLTAGPGAPILTSERVAELLEDFP